MFSQTAEYALRAIVYLAHERKRPRTTAEIAAATDAPSGYLAKVMKGLTRAGIVDSRRGLRGGFSLACEPGDLTILDVARAVDAFQRVEQCPLGRPAHTSGLCPLHRRIDDVIAEAERAFGVISIGDVIQEPNLLCGLPCVSETLETLPAGDQPR